LPALAIFVEVNGNRPPLNPLSVPAAVAAGPRECNTVLLLTLMLLLLLLLLLVIGLLRGRGAGRAEELIRLCGRYVNEQTNQTREFAAARSHGQLSVRIGWMFRGASENDRVAFHSHTADCASQRMHCHAAIF
jgi:hypothetical protein